MTRFLFCIIPERGHVNPYIGPMQALQAAGHEVFVHASANIAPQLHAAGIMNFVGSTQPPSDEHRGAAFAERVKDSAWLRTWVKALLVDTAEAAIEPLRLTMEEARPDVVVIDPMVYAAAIAAKKQKRPWVAMSNSLNPALPHGLDSELLSTVEWLAPERAALFERHGMTPQFRGCDILSPDLTIAFTTRELVGDIPGVALVGPSLPRANRGDEVPFPWDWLDPSRPLIYASFGSQIYHQPALLRRIFDAVAYRPVQLVASVSELATSAELGGARPGNVLLRSYVPQLAVLKRARLMITHGGANSVMEAIACGVPLLLAPLCNDQFHQVHFITKAGIGRALDAEQCRRADIGTALDELLANGPERRALGPITASYQRDGAAEAARLLNELAAKSLRELGS